MCDLRHTRALAYTHAKAVYFRLVTARTHTPADEADEATMRAVPHVRTREHYNLLSGWRTLRSTIESNNGETGLRKCRGWKLKRETAGGGARAQQRRDGGRTRASGEKKDRGLLKTKINEKEEKNARAHA